MSNRRAQIEAAAIKLNDTNQYLLKKKSQIVKDLEEIIKSNKELEDLIQKKDSNRISDKIKDECTASRNELLKLRHELSEKQNNNILVEATIKQMVQKLCSIRTERKEFEAKNNQATDDLDKLNTNLESLQSNPTPSEKRKTLKAQLSSDISEWDATKNELTNLCEEASTKLGSLVDEELKLEGQKRDLDNKIREYEGRYDRRLDSVEAFKNSNIADDIIKIESEIEKIKRLNLETNKSIDDTTARIKSVVTQYRKQREVLLNHKKKFLVLEESIRQLNKEAEDVVNTKTEACTFDDDDDVLKLKEVIDLADDEIEQKKQMKLDAIKRSKGLDDEIKKAEEELKEIKQKNETEINKLNTDNAKLLKMMNNLAEDGEIV